MLRSPLPNLISRWMAGLAALLVVLVVWGGFEIRDEVVESPAPRAVRLTAAAPETGNAIEYVEGYEAGLRRATAENRPLLVVFRAGWWGSPGSSSVSWSMPIGTPPTAAGLA